MYFRHMQEADIIGPSHFRSLACWCRRGRPTELDSKLLCRMLKVEIFMKGLVNDPMDQIVFVCLFKLGVGYSKALK